MICKFYQKIRIDFFSTRSLLDLHMQTKCGSFNFWCFLLSPSALAFLEFCAWLCSRRLQICFAHIAFPFQFSISYRSRVRGTALWKFTFSSDSSLFLHHAKLRAPTTLLYLVTLLSASLVSSVLKLIERPRQIQFLLNHTFFLWNFLRHIVLQILTNMLCSYLPIISEIAHANQYLLLLYFARSLHCYLLSIPLILYWVKWAISQFLIFRRRVLSASLSHVFLLCHELLYCLAQNLFLIRES